MSARHTSSAAASRPAAADVPDKGSPELLTGTLPASLPPRGAGSPKTPGAPGWGSLGAPGKTRRRKPQLTGLALMASLMSEDELDGHLRNAIKDLERKGFRLLRFHPWSSKHSASGWPDWALCGPGGFMLRELKKERAEPRPDQQEWLDWAAAAGIDTGVWKPSDWYSGRITRELAALAGIGRAA